MKRLVCIILALLVVIPPLLLLTVDFVRFPECYITTWKYQLGRELAKGDEMAVEYYENTYLANGRILFD